MAPIRRVYSYLLAAAGLGMLTSGVAMVARTLLELALQAPPVAAAGSEGYVRESVSLWGAAALVGLPVWLLHWTWAERTARAHADERTSTLRHLYLYGVLAVSLVIAATSANTILQAPLDALAGVGRSGLQGLAAAEAAPWLAVAALVWLYHWRVAGRDRALVGERGGSATLRRWYIYGTALVAFVLMLGGARQIVGDLWDALAAAGEASPAAARPPLGASGVPDALVGLALWLGHWRVIPRGLGADEWHDDRRSALRSVYLFLALAVCVVAALAGVSQLLYYAVARGLGVERPGGVGGSLLAAAAGPGSAALVFGLGWAYQRWAIRQQAAAVAEAPRQAGTRRLYAYLVALVALALLAGGVAGLLWTLVTLVWQSPGGLASESWRSDVALGTTAALVGLPVWLANWRPSAAIADDEARAFSRRLYAYLALIGAMLALLGAAAGLLYRLLTLALGAEASSTLLADLGHTLAVVLVSAVVAAYHWRVVRADAARAAISTPAVVAASAVTPVALLLRVSGPSRASLDEALGRLRHDGLVVEVLESEPQPAARS